MATWGAGRAWGTTAILAVTTATAVVATISIDIDKRQNILQEAVDGLKAEEPLKLTIKGTVTEADGTHHRIIVETRREENESVEDLRARHAAEQAEAEAEFGNALVWDRNPNPN